MLPVVRHREVALARQALLLDVAPVMVGAPHHAAGEARLEGHRARAVVTAKRHAFEADTARVDIVTRLEPVDHLAGPAFAVDHGVHAVQAQRFAGARLVDDQRGDAALRQPARQADAVLEFLARIEAVDLHQQRRRAGHAFGAHIQARDMGVAIRDLDPFAVLAGQLDAAREHGQEAPVQLQAPGRVMRLQALGDHQVDGGAAILVAGRDQATARLVFFGQAAQLVGHAGPGLTKRRSAGGIGLLRRVLQRCAHFLDLANARTHLDGQVDRQIPWIVRGEVFEHVVSFSM